MIGLLQHNNSDSRWSAYLQTYETLSWKRIVTIAATLAIHLSFAFLLLLPFTPEIPHISRATRPADIAVRLINTSALSRTAERLVFEVPFTLAPGTTQNTSHIPPHIIHSVVRSQKSPKRSKILLLRLRRQFLADPILVSGTGFNTKKSVSGLLPGSSHPIVKGFRFAQPPMSWLMNVKGMLGCAQIIYASHLLPWVRDRMGLTRHAMQLSGCFK